ncbi:MAG: NYN domain-containing protein [Burkholderiales bacterium]
MSHQLKVMLLIDADNVSIDVIEQTVHHLLEEFGALHGRRAYCNPESALKHQSTFKRLGIRPMVNLAAGKNSTDIALAVDTMELVMRERPDVLAIASSDSDFAPLVTRVREKGCRVLGFGQSGKTGEATLMLYDRFVQFSARGQLVEPDAPRPARKVSARKTAAAPKPARKPAPPTAAEPALKPAPAPAPKPVLEAAPVPAPARKAAAPKRGRRAPEASSSGADVADVVAALLAEEEAEAPLAPAAPKRADEVQRLLAVAPELQQGATVDLNRVAEALRKLALLGKNASSIRWLKKFPEVFELTPASKPNKVRLKP